MDIFDNFDLNENDKNKSKLLKNKRAKTDKIEKLDEIKDKNDKNDKNDKSEDVNESSTYITENVNVICKKKKKEQENKGEIEIFKENYSSEEKILEMKFNSLFGDKFNLNNCIDSDKILGKTYFVEGCLHEVFYMNDSNLECKFQIIKLMKREFLSLIKNTNLN